MREIAITLTDEQEQFLKEFASKQGEGSKDNLEAKHPLHLVQTRKEVVVDPDYDEPDKTVYFVPDWQESFELVEGLVKAFYEYEGDECPIKIVSFQEAYD